MNCKGGPYLTNNECVHVYESDIIIYFYDNVYGLLINLFSRIKYPIQI
mgnify:CR=1 FL=1|jgi:hypothetical protein